MTTTTTSKKNKKKGVRMGTKVEKTDGTRSFWLSRITFCVCFFVSVGLFIGGFFVPPMGIIDGSILKAVGELLAYPTLLYCFRAFELGYKIKFQKGETSIELNNHEDCGHRS